MDRLDRRGFFASSARAGLGLAAGAWAATSILEATGVSDSSSGVGPNCAAAADVPSATPGPKIGGFTKSFQDRPIPEVCRMFKQIGLDGLDLTVRPKGHIEPEQVAQELPKAVAAAKEAGVEILFLTTAITDGWRTKTVPIADGMCPLPRFIATLKTVGYVGTYSLHSEYQGSHSFRELSTDECLQQTAVDLKYLRTLL